MQLRELGALFIGILLMPPHPSILSNALKCYKCASEAIIMNWGRYLPMLSESESSSDRSCISGNTSIDSVPCDGPCMLLNVTFEYKATTHIIGVMRDCRTTYYSRGNSSKEAKYCISRMIPIRGRQYNATYCFCDFDYCNGATRPQNYRSRSYGHRGLSADAPGSIVSLSLLIFLLCIPQQFLFYPV